jgi:hypothetical protein
MTEQAAVGVVREASQDRRLIALLDTRYVSKKGQGYRVRLEMQRPGRHYVLVASTAADWRQIQSLWSGL